MDRKNRTQILIKSKNNLAHLLSKEITQKYNVEKIESPSNGLVMVKVRETAQKELFYLGEVLITEAKCRINNKIGKGIVIGDNYKLAEELAIIDAAYNANLEEVKLWDSKLLDEKNNIEKYEKEETKKILETKVDFTTMAN